MEDIEKEFGLTPLRDYRIRAAKAVESARSKAARPAHAGLRRTRAGVARGNQFQQVFRAAGLPRLPDEYSGDVWFQTPL